MEIRRVEPELIPPAPASEHGAHIEMHRRPPDQGQQRGKHPRQHEAAPAEDDTVAGEHSAGMTVYDTDGHVQAHDAADDRHTIDFKA